jgi:hypothetical protein
MYDCGVAKTDALEPLSLDGDVLDRSAGEER